MSGYTIGEILVWLLLAALLGGLLGWFLRQLKCEREHGAAVRPVSVATPTTTSNVAATPMVGSSTAASAPAKKAPVKAAAKKAPVKTVAKKAPAKTVAKKAPAKTVAKKAPAKTVAKKAPVKKAPAKAAAKKAPAKTAAKKAPVKTVAKKAPAKRAPAKKAPAKKVVAVGKFPGSAKPLSGGRAPSAAYKIKGNEDSMIYHAPDSPSYGQTIAETWFKTEAAAVAAGFRKPRNA